MTIYNKNVGCRSCGVRAEVKIDEILPDLVLIPTNLRVFLHFFIKDILTEIFLIFSHFLNAKILGIKFRNNSGLAIRNDKSRIMLDQAVIIR